MPRSFIAFSLSKDAQLALSHTCQILKKQDTRHLVRWQQAENRHLTLAFLGQVEAPALEKLALYLQNQLAGSSAITLTLTEARGFPPNKAYPKVIAALCPQTAEITDLFMKVKTAIEQCPLPPPDKEFIPHITLGKLKKNRSATPFQSLKINQPSVFSEVVIYESTNTPTGPIYQPLHRFTLSGERYDQ